MRQDEDPAKTRFGRERRTPLGKRMSHPRWAKKKICSQQQTHDITRIETAERPRLWKSRAFMRRKLH